SLVRGERSPATSYPCPRRLSPLRSHRSQAGRNIEQREITPPTGTISAGGKGGEGVGAIETGYKRLEEISLNGWPALETVLLDGWLLRFADGYTKRSNSVSAIYDGGLETDKKIRTCEELYRARGLTPVFKVTPFVNPKNLDE